MLTITITNNNHHENNITAPFRLAPPNDSNLGNPYFSGLSRSLSRVFAPPLPAGSTSPAPLLGLSPYLSSAAFSLLLFQQVQLSPAPLLGLSPYLSSAAFFAAPLPAGSTLSSPTFRLIPIPQLSRVFAPSLQAGSTLSGPTFRLIPIPQLSRVFAPPIQAGSTSPAPLLGLSPYLSLRPHFPYYVFAFAFACRAISYRRSARSGRLTATWRSMVRPITTT